jgi:hypothetical protein
LWGCLFNNKDHGQWSYCLWPEEAKPENQDDDNVLVAVSLGVPCLVASIVDF